MSNMNQYNTTLIFIILTTSHATFANTFADIDFGISSDDNLSRSDYTYDKKADTAVELYADYGNFYELADNWSTTASVFAQLKNYSTYTEFSSFGYGIAGSARKKLGLGAYSSALKLTASYGIYNAQDNNRDNTALALGIGWDKRLDERWILAAGLTLDSTDAKNRTYDTQGTTYYVSADYSINDNLLMTFGISQRKGDIVSVTNSASNPKNSYLNTASGGNKTTDKVFGTGLTAYRIDASTLILKAGLSYALNNNSSVNIGYEYQNSALPYGISYINNIIHLNYIYRY